MSSLTVIDVPLSEEERRILAADKTIYRRRLQAGEDIRPELAMTARRIVDEEVRRLQVLVFRLLRDRPLGLSQEGGTTEPKTPHDRMERALRDAMAFLSRVPEADELCDRIIGLLEPGACGIDGCKDKADDVVYDRCVKQVVRCCTRHADALLYYDNTEYCQLCPNCGCDIPIN